MSILLIPATNVTSLIHTGTGFVIIAKYVTHRTSSDTCVYLSFYIGADFRAFFAHVFILGRRYCWFEEVAASGLSSHDSFHLSTVEWEYNVSRTD